MACNVRRGKESIGRLVVILSLLGGAITVGGCEDKHRLQTGAQLSSDGKAVADAYIAYMNNTADLYAAQCELENFSQSLAFRQARTDVGVLTTQAKTCMDEAARRENIAKLKSWAKDAEAVSAVYASLEKLTAEANVTNAQSAVDNLATDIANATNSSVSDHVKAALDAASKAAVDHVDAQGVKKFALAMVGVPEALLQTINESDRAAFLDNVYQQYDLRVKQAVADAYVNQVADPAPLLEKFFAKLGMNMVPAAVHDPYLAAFASTLDDGIIASAGPRSRSALIGLLKGVSAETASITSVDTKPSTFRNDIVALMDLQKLIAGVVHPASKASSSPK